ncbi:MAG: formylglycine-generating enzyme family protein [Prevotellaceae bacterium]|jgi:formylglycine-generating enzyme required for sulfatase activity|nr:formylglycine-generating enzyme family protein [Prevotellaceae bacterium]
MKRISIVFFFLLLIAVTCQTIRQTNQDARSSNLVLQSIFDNMVYVEGGTFMMGCTTEQESDCFDNEKPAHQVSVSSFNISKYVVTQRQWNEVMRTTLRQQRDLANPSWDLISEGDDYPMYYVSWEEVQQFIAKLNYMTGNFYRLPTEAEWEYAARGGNKSTDYKYAGSNIEEEVAWLDINSSNRMHPVGGKRPNELGLYDMSGNVWEWCYDWFGSYRASVQANPAGPSSGANRVLRGGSWNRGAKHCCVSSRHNYGPGFRYNDVGFRLVLSN